MAGSRWRVRSLADPLTGEVILAARKTGRPAVFCAPVPGTVQKFALVAVRFGAKDRAFRSAGRWRAVPAGAAHFLEHQLFEGESVNAMERFAALGASANAYTDYGETAYHVSCVDRFGPALAELLRLVRRPAFTGETVRKEKGIIVQEIRMYQDDPDSACVQDLHRLLYARHPARDDIAGTIASVRQTSVEDLYAAYWTFYHPANMVVAAAGDVSLEGVLAAVDDAFARSASGQPRPWSRPRRRPVAEPPRVARRFARRRMEVPRPKALIAFKEIRTGLSGDTLVRQRIATMLAGDLLFGPASRFRERAVRAGLVDDDFGFGHQAGDDFGYSIVGGRTRDPARLRRETLNEIARAVDEGISPPDFERVRTKSLGSALKAFHSPSAVARSAASCHFAGVHPFAWHRILGRMAPADVAARLVEHFREALSVMAVVEPR